MLLRQSGILPVIAIWAVWTVAPTASVRAAQGTEEEITYPSEEFAKLDAFEGLNLEDGDKLFAKKDYAGALAEYKAYSTDFPKGKALAYAVLRMGRCLHLTKKRAAAIRLYQEVVDYFPNDVRYAAAALYYMGLAHQENGDDKQCIATWARMVKDKDYVTQARSARALNYLAAQMDKQEAYEEAAKYRWRVALEFRKDNPEVANAAKDSVLYHYVIRSPSHEQFMAFYKEVGGWGHKGDFNDLDNNVYYWDAVLDRVLYTPGKHPESKEAHAARKKAAPYWIGKFGSKFVTNDQMRERAADMQLLADGDRAAWVTLLQGQVASMPMSMGRLLYWLGVFGEVPAAQSDLLQKHAGVIAGAKVEELKTLISRAAPEFRSKLYADHLAGAIPGMKRSEQIEMAGFLAGGVGLPDEAKAAFYAIDMKGITDPELVTLAHLAGRLDGEAAAMGYFNRMTDKKSSLKAKCDWYLGKAGGRSLDPAAAENALALMDEVAKYPEWAQATLWPKAELLHRLGRYPEAIKAYKATGKEPDATWEVAECLLAMKDYPRAVTTVTALESVGGGVAAQACIKVADIYKMAGNKTKEIEQLRLVLHRYPKSSQSSVAHQRLENYGAKITGGEAEANK